MNSFFYLKRIARSSRLIAFSLFISLSFFACQTEQKVTPAFYHWKTNPDDLAQLEGTLEQLEIEKIYWRAFDVEWSAQHNMPIPTATAEFVDSLADHILIIPTIFITNNTFKNIKPQAIENFSNLFIQKIKNQFPKLSEVQIDCDWTQSTKEKYFHFLEIIQQKTNWICSVTIRLHQLLYAEQTGLPPVSSGTLMFYNMGEVSQWSETNSILNLEKAAPYLKGLRNYQLPLDLALPLFSWGVLFRNGKMIKLINNLTSFDLKDTTRFQAIDSSRYKVITSTFLDGLYLYEEDLIRIEKVNFSLLKEALSQIKPYFKNKSFTLTFYHLDAKLINRFTYDQLEQLYKSFD